MRKKSKGFMLLETLMVSLTITGLLIYIYTQYVKINDSYKDIYQYNTPNEMYILAYLRDDILENSQPRVFTDLNNNTNTGCIGGNSGLNYISGTTDYKILTSVNVINELNIKDIYFCKGTVTDAQRRNLINSVNSVSLKRFISLMTNTTEDYRLIVEFNDGKAATLKFSKKEG